MTTSLNRVQAEAERVALSLAHGDRRRVRVIANDEVLVVNRPSQPTPTRRTRAKRGKR